jgi:energy-coupling factor transporter ATP-binding protein EcfA2
LKTVIGPGVTSFGGSKDKGRDAAFIGPAAFPTSDCQWTGDWVFQVKYIDFEERGVDAARSSLQSALRNEIRNGLSRHGNTSNYILLTDVPLTAQSRSELNEIVGDCGFEGNFACVDGKEICQFLDMHGDIRKSYPQLLGLADLDVIVNRDLYARSQAYLADWQPRLAAYVQTEAHTKAMALLKKKHFIVLDGPPEAGKSTIAAALALIHAADGFEIIDVRSSNDVFRASDEKNANGKKQERQRLFIADDAIGSISLVAARADEWSRDILRQLSNRRLLVWTARRYILEEALATSRLGEATSEFPRQHEVLVEVGKLSLMQKAEILYNHAKQANLSIEHRELIRTHAIQIVTHANFSPLRIRELTSVVLKSSTSNAQGPGLLWDSLRDFLNNPGERWVKAFQNLSQSEQVLLLGMLDFDGPTTARTLRAAYERRVSRREGGHLSFEDCVARLDHSFLTVTSSHSGEKYISFEHPSLRDMLLTHLRGDPEARRRYISLASPFGLTGMMGGIAEFSESESTPQHAIVPVDDDEFELFLGRLRGVSQTVLNLNEWDLLLTACERLIPQKTTTSAESAPVMSDFLELLGDTLPAERVEPVDLDLEAFAGSWKGKIIHAVLEGFSSKRTLENGQRFSPDAWVRLLTRFYGLTSYLSPPLYPAFTSSLCDGLSNSADSIRLANLINRAEPLVAKQRITRSVREDWKSELDAEAIALIRQGEGFESTDDPDEFDEWRFTARKLLATSEDFFRWGITAPADGIEELKKVLELANRPREQESEDYSDQQLPDSGPYWTVERLFEDL